ncbi:23S rRNA (adenine(1618)-N(6))-methyltransferase RlmF [Pontibacter sp. E15-1]|uniref:23S rRNA (adenine(1618)-N(6))-methyltransferase RlmF n=1 Tax=Pontibacter sp. E15-1 TaxID=2919918 RepID=UPI001F4F6635|nr:23S rRNA (adenine(1618)-N(6))-methyltransferase RlmF [Pontibacter sp. E15-1]MCJ8163794.1 23S rRNA (adenine(1618)-N(6))-methyltransferase RlmF [Pontibacter sp. E15-1]
MAHQKKSYPKEKAGLHPRNRHRERYDFPKLIKSCPALGPFVTVNAYNDASVNFFDPQAVKTLNKALLAHFYGVKHWDIPAGYLCPPIPGRADYIHHVADLLGSANKGMIPEGRGITCLDVGVGASCVYPIIGNREYGWSFIGADIDPVSIASSQRIIDANPTLKSSVKLRLQQNPKDIFRGMLQPGERIDLTVCNPPFHASLAEAQAGSLRKLGNLQQKKTAKPVLNFGGQKAELWCAGGESRFVNDMIYQSKQFAASCLWFSTLISKQTNLKGAYNALTKAGAADVRTIPMAHGNKISRIVAWTFLSPEQQQAWISAKWRKPTQ